MDRLAVEFDDERAVANAGLLLLAMLAERLGIEALTGRLIGRAGSAGRREAGPQGVDAAACDAARRRLDRRLRRAPLGPHGALLGSGAGALDAGDVLARVHVRACAPARPVLAESLVRAWAAGGGPGGAGS